MRQTERISPDTNPKQKSPKKRNLRKKWLLALPILLPPAIWMFVFLFLPYLNLFSYSFWKPGMFNVVKEFTVDNYTKFFVSKNGAEPPYTILLDTLQLSLTVTFFTILISLPLAYYINFKVTRYKQMLYMLVIIPLWVSYIVRAYAWKIILGTNGILNSFLMYVGITDKPIDIFLYSSISVTIGMVHIYTPFVLMPIYTAMEQIPRHLLEASKDLGANRVVTFFKVVFPLALPGIIAGGTFAFVLSMGDFLAPSLLGGPNSSTMIANVVQQQFGTSNNWPYGSAIGIIILILVLAVLEVTGRAEKKYESLDRND